jgi:hypothetical protein
MKTTTLLLTSCACALSFSAQAENWNHEVHGSFPVFLTYIDKEGGEQGMRIMSGFNPAHLAITSSAPKQGGLDISGTFRVDSHLQGSQEQNSGKFVSRVADIQIKGDFGQLNIGKGFGIFNSNAIGDVGSGKGVGLMGVDQNGTTGGRIGTGYVYANFNPRIIFSNNIDDKTSYKVGIFNPEEPVGSVAETSLPRFEGQVTTAMGAHSVWAGFMFQTVEAAAEDYDIQAFDIGGQFNAGAIGVRAAYTITQSIGADGLYGYEPGQVAGVIRDATADGSQFYIETTYGMNDMTYGVSYGLGTQDSGTNVSGAIPEIENTLAMAFAHKKITDNLHAMFELQSYSSETNSVTTHEYTALSTGFQLDF